MIHEDDKTLSEIKDFMKAEHMHVFHDVYVTKKDLKIALSEFAEKYKLGWMNVKLNFLLFGMGCIAKVLYDILQRLPQ